MIKTYYGELIHLFYVVVSLYGLVSVKLNAFSVN